MVLRYFYKTSPPFSDKKQFGKMILRRTSWNGEKRQHLFLLLGSHRRFLPLSFSSLVKTCKDILNFFESIWNTLRMVFSSPIHIIQACWSMKLEWTWSFLRRISLSWKESTVALLRCSPQKIYFEPHQFIWYNHYFILIDDSFDDSAYCQRSLIATFSSIGLFRILPIHMSYNCYFRDG